MPKFIIAIPSITPSRVLANVAFYQQVKDLGGQVIVIGNSVDFETLDLDGSATIITTGSNNGFAGSINLAANSTTDWEWILLLNDDVKISKKDLEEIQQTIPTINETKWIINCDPGTPRMIPKLAEVFLNLSLLEAIARKFKKSKTFSPIDPNPYQLSSMPRNHYASFSITAISRETWKSTGELNQAMPFCYEDADYTLRAVSHGSVQSYRFPLEATHDTSASTKSNINTVLPVVTYSAITYLASLGISALVTRLTISVALLIRVPFVLVNSAPRKRHFQGISSSFRTVWTKQKPSLPAYDSIG